MDEAGIDRAPGQVFKRWLPLVLLVAALGAVYLSGVQRYLSFHAFSDHREWLVAEVAEYGFWAPVAFMTMYAVAIALSIPSGLFLSVLGGFLFGTLLGAIYDLIGATIGATGVFLIARTSLGDVLRRRAGPFLRRVEAGFQENATSYLLILRLVPLFPLWLVNLVPAFLGVRLRTYLLCTFFGMAPAAFVYASVGGGLGAVLDRGEMPDLRIIFEPRFLLPLVALALLASLPALYKRWKRTR